MTTATQTTEAAFVPLGSRQDQKTNPNHLSLRAKIQGTFLSRIEFEEGSEWLQVDREVDEGTERLRLRLPCVLTCDLRLNQPRYVTLPNLMRAKKKPLEILTPADLKVELKSHWQVTRVDEPPSRRRVVMLKHVDELVTKLRQLGVLNSS